MLMREGGCRPGCTVSQLPARSPWAERCPERGLSERRRVAESARKAERNMACGGAGVSKRDGKAGVTELSAATPL